MREGQQQIHKDIEDALKNPLLSPKGPDGRMPLEPEEFADGTKTGIRIEKPSSLEDEVAVIASGLKQVEFIPEVAKRTKEIAAKKVLDAQHADEEREWEGAIKLAKQKIADAEAISAQSAPKGKGVDLRDKIKTTLAAEEAARKQADDDRWEAAELSARKRIGEEEQGWEDAELKARKKLGLEAHAQDEKREKNQSGIRRLMERLGLRKKESK
ncbi:MAG: hypothetical protein KBC69_02170 [Candidatus Magasanikbacteria bacterium]|nr:hypothetical protein [Candidatus Magasanikbacteria bacterium]